MKIDKPSPLSDPNKRVGKNFYSDSYGSLFEGQVSKGVGRCDVTRMLIKHDDSIVAFVTLVEDDQASRIYAVALGKVVDVHLDSIIAMPIGLDRSIVPMSTT